MNELGGMTPFEVTQKYGFPCHKSQQWTDFTQWLNGYNGEIKKASQIYSNNPTKFGLYRSTVGEDRLKNDFMEKYFGRANGLRYNFGRCHINSCDFSLDIYDYVQSGDKELSTFNMERERKYVIPFIKDAQKYTGEDLMLFASPWSPPAYMKQNESAVEGGTLKEEYMDIMDTLPKLYIECAKYGIIFILSSVDTQVLRGKEAGAFGHVIALKVNNDDYSLILGKAAKDIIPKDLKGRGLIEIDKVVYEFQTASICEENKLQQAMKQICTTLANGYKMKVPPIPMIPPALNIDVIPTDKLSINSVIDGYLKATIQPHYVDLQKNFGTVIIGVKKSEITDYCRVLYRQFQTI